MILRIWRGLIRTEQAEAYAAIVERTGVAEYRTTPGNLDAQLALRDLGDGRSEIMTLSWWESREHIVAFAGEDIEAAHYYPEDDDYLLERDPQVRHFEVRSSDG